VEVGLSDDQGLGEMLLYASFGAGNTTCTTISGPFFLGGALTATIPVSFRVPGCAFPGDPIQILAKASDQAGNVGYSLPDTSLSIVSLGATAQAGYTMGTFAYRNKLKQNDVPADVAVDPVSGVAYVSLANNNRVVVVFPDRTQNDLRDPNNNRINFNQPFGLALESGGTLFVADFGNLQIDRVWPDRIVDRGVVQNVYSGRMAIDETNAIPLFCLTRVLGGAAVECMTDYLTTPVTLLTIPTADLAAAGVNLPTSVAFVGSQLWILDGSCTVVTTTLTYDAAAGTVTVGPLTTVTPTGPATFGGTCGDIVGLPSGDVAIVDDGAQQVVRMSATGTLDLIADGFNNPVALDFQGNTLYVLDGAGEALYTITGAF
jgi:hypothetical protein